MDNHEQGNEPIVSTGNGVAIGGLFIGMGICIHGGSFVGATWLLILYIAGFLFVAKVMGESKKEPSAASRGDGDEGAIYEPDRG